MKEEDTVDGREMGVILNGGREGRGEGEGDKGCDEGR